MQQFAAASVNAPAPAPVVGDGWDGDDSWDDDEDDNALAFSNIGGGTQTYKPTSATSGASMSGFSGGIDDDDPFASLGMKTSTSVKPRVGRAKGKLTVPKKAPPAKKLTMEASDVGDGWDDF